MALDSDQKRGSVIDLWIPFREWVAAPNATVAQSQQQSIVRMAAEPLADAPGGSTAYPNYYYQQL